MSPDHTRLVLVKVLHTAIWVAFNIVLLYLLYAVVINRIDYYVWTGISLILAEGLVLLVFRNHCPLTLVARNYSDSAKANFDIYLPEWLARNNKKVYTTLFVFILLLLFYRLISG